MSDENLKISVIGTGKIVNEVLPLVTSPGMGYKVTSIYAHSSIDNARKLADEYGIPRIFTDYDQLLREDDADFIYIANINPAHYCFAKQALEAGRNIIVEKPLCTTFDDAATLVDLAREKHLYMFEAVSLLYNPVFEGIAASIPELGKISMLTSNYSQRSSRYDKYCNNIVAPAFDPALAGGALMDLNVYNLNFTIGLFGAPGSVAYFPRLGYNGVDLSGAALLTYDNFPAVCCAAKDSDAPSGAVIQGDAGYIEVKSSVSVLTRAEVHVCDAPVKVYEVPEGSHRLEFEFRRFREIFMAGDYDEMYRRCDTALQVMRVLSELRGS